MLHQVISSPLERERSRERHWVTIEKAIVIGPRDHEYIVSMRVVTDIHRHNGEVRVGEVGNDMIFALSTSLALREQPE